ncbi:MAG TPA: hypothetical protein VK420_12190 [Longimicrobium sp.]|nr:hypothetical protein [Longimicrobium sp.]
MNRRPHELLSHVLRTPAWTLDMLDSAGNVEPVRADWNDPMIYWSSDGMRLTIA